METGSDERRATPRGLVSRSLIAATVFAAAVVPGWTLGELVERWTGWVLLDFTVTTGWSAVAVYVLAPYASYRRRDALLALVPLLGWYLTCVLSWRVALLPYRDWEPRADELWRARWCAGDLVGFWRAEPLPVPTRRSRNARGAAAGAGSGRSRPARGATRSVTRRPGAPAR
ncbi:MAG TPA: hypothetical protein VFO77_14690 [Actinoplanes sp.]|nr:hypothetical protein [Actinoplanes sp.]